MDQSTAAADWNDEVGKVEVAVGTGADASTRCIGFNERHERAWDHHRLAGGESVQFSPRRWRDSVVILLAERWRHTRLAQQPLEPVIQLLFDRREIVEGKVGVGGVSS